MLFVAPSTFKFFFSCNQCIKEKVQFWANTLYLVNNQKLKLNSITAIILQVNKLTSSPELSWTATSSTQVDLTTPPQNGGKSA